MYLLVSWQRSSSHDLGLDPVLVFDHPCLFSTLHGAVLEERTWPDNLAVAGGRLSNLNSDQVFTPYACSWMYLWLNTSRKGACSGACRRYISTRVSLVAHRSARTWEAWLLRHLVDLPTSCSWQVVGFGGRVLLFIMAAAKVGTICWFIFAKLYGVPETDSRVVGISVFVTRQWIWYAGIRAFFRVTQAGDGILGVFLSCLTFSRPGSPLCISSGYHVGKTCASLYLHRCCSGCWICCGWTTPSRYGYRLSVTRFLGWCNVPMGGSCEQNQGSIHNSFIREYEGSCCGSPSRQQNIVSYPIGCLVCGQIE